MGSFLTHKIRKLIGLLLIRLEFKTIEIEKPQLMIRKSTKLTILGRKMEGIYSFNMSLFQISRLLGRLKSRRGILILLTVFP